MVVLLIGMAVAAVVMGAALPAWRQQATREKEEELIFRGTQYARALFLYAEKNARTLPTDIDVLVNQKYLRKKYKDPITGKDFALLPAGAAPGQGGGQTPLGGTPGRGQTPFGSPGGATQTPRGGGAPGPSQGVGAPPAGGAPGVAPGSSGGGLPSGGVSQNQLIGQIAGVVSTSSATSIKIYKNAQQYDQWQFRYEDMRLLMRGAPAGGQNRPGGTQQVGPGGGGPGGGPGGGVPGRGGPGGGPGGGRDGAPVPGPRRGGGG